MKGSQRTVRLKCGNSDFYVEMAKEDFIKANGITDENSVEHDLGVCADGWRTIEWVITT